MQCHQSKNCKETWGGKKGKQKYAQTTQAEDEIKSFHIFLLRYLFSLKECRVYKTAIYKIGVIFFKIAATQSDYDAVLNRSSIFF